MVKFVVLCAFLLMVVILFKCGQLDSKANGNGSNYHQHKIRHKHGEWISIDFYAYASNIRHWNAAFKVSFSVVTIILCILFNNPYVSTAVIVAMACLTVVKGGVPVNEYFTILAIPIVFILISVLTIVIDISKQPIGQYNFHFMFFYLFTTKAILKKGLFLILKIFGAISALQMMALSTPSSEIICVLRKVHVPRLIVELMNMIYRFIFILMDVSVKMNNAAQSRHGYCDIKTSWYTFGRIASNMLIISLKKANAYFDAMESRCYDGELTFLEENKGVKKELIFAAMIFIVFLVVLWSSTR